ncbi:MAG: SpoIID/LytB domain-containing protein [Leptolyngbyaceae cyanobacterium bins.59]|nr:SpoIID/LytB domain-containing protein [Leptolyngbyaceae cyanobacterium bins.59]
MMSSQLSTTLRLPVQQWFLLKGRPWWVAALIWLAMVTPARAQVELRVAITQETPKVEVGSSTPAVVRDRAGRVLGQLPPSSAVDAQGKAGSVTLLNRWRGQQLWVEPQAGGLVWIGDRWYRGRVLLMADRKGMTAVNYVDLEQYLSSVLGGEMNGNWPQEALKAQAVAARSYALYQRQRSLRNPFDVGTTTTWQVYKGVEKESVGTQSAVAATTGQVLTHQGKIIEAVFHSSSGGATENSENVWTRPVPYLQGVPDFDQGTPNFEWVRTFTAEEMRRRIPGVGNVISLIPQRRGVSGRIVTMKVVGDAGSRVLSGSTLRNALDLKSTLFTITPQFSLASNKGTQTTPSTFQVTGRGFGHGLGMSQWGAYNMALQGMSYQQIVRHYYRGATLSKIQVR